MDNETWLLMHDVKGYLGDTNLGTRLGRWLWKHRHIVIHEVTMPFWANEYHFKFQCEK